MLSHCLLAFFGPPRRNSSVSIPEALGEVSERACFNGVPAQAGHAK